MAFINRASVTVNLPRQVRRQTRRHINCAISECGFCNLWNPGSKAQTDWFKPSDRLQFETVIACGDSCGCSSVGRAPRCQRGCRGFESLHPLFFIDFGLRRSGTGPETSAAAVSLLTLDVYSRSELACCRLRLFPQRRLIRPSELPGIVCSSRTLPGVRCIQCILCIQDGIRNACELFASCPIVRSRCSSSSRPDLL